MRCNTCGALDGVCGGIHGVVNEEKLEQAERVAALRDALETLIGRPLNAAETEALQSLSDTAATALLRYESSQDALRELLTEHRKVVERAEQAERERDELREWVAIRLYATNEPYRFEHWTGDGWSWPTLDDCREYVAEAARAGRGG